MFSFFDRNSVTCCWNTDEEGRLIPTPSLQPLQPQGRTQRSQGAEAIPRRGLRPSMSSLPRRSPHCHPPFCHLENSVEAPRKTVPQSSPAKKKIMEFLVWHAALDGCSLHGDPHHSPPLPRHWHCALQSDNTWLGLVAHLYISATSILITLAAFLLRGLLLLPLFLWLLPASTSRFRFEEESTQTGRN